MKVIIEPSFVITVFVFLLSGDMEYVFLMLFSALIHECGHLLTLRLYKVRVKALVLGLFGGTIVLQKKLISYKGDFFVAISGSLANLIFSVMLFFLLRYRFSTPLFFFFLSNVTYALFNLLPVSNLDGGMALRSLLLIKKEPYEAERIVGLVSRISLFLLAFGGLWLVGICAFNISLLVIVILLYAESTGGHIISGYEFCRKTS